MKRFKNIITNQKLLFWLFLFMAILPNFMMWFTEPTSVMVRLLQIVLPLGFYGTVLTLTRKPGKAFWWIFIFMFFDAFEIVLLRLYGESPIAVDMFLNVVTTNPGEVDELLSNLLLAVVFVIGLYGLGIALSIVSLRTKKELAATFRKRQRLWAVPLLAIGMAVLAGDLFTGRRIKPQDNVFPINASYNLGLAVHRFVKGTQYDKLSQDFTYNATTTRQDTVPEIYVLVIGETSRADNWHLYGYERNTNPRLSQRGDLVVYRDAITMSNTTHKSVPMLLSGIASEAFDSIYYRKGIITAFNEAGFKTAFFSNQQRNHSFIDAFGSEAQEVKFLKDKVSLMGNNYDDELIDCVKQRLNNYHGGKLLIVVHMYGSHFNYHDRYTAREALFTPDNVISAEKVYRKELINAYDNSIVETDKVVGQIINLVESKNVNSAVIFTSDHGEDIFDDERGRFLHASPLPTYFQLRVPLIVWMSPQYRQEHGQICDFISKHCAQPVATNMVVFHTLLDMGGISTSQFKPQLSLANKAFTPQRRLYVNDHNEFQAFDSCGLKPIDVQHFRSHNLQFP